MEEELALEDLGGEEQRQREPWIDQGGNDGAQCKSDAAAENVVKRAELEAGAVVVRSPVRTAVVAEEEEFRKYFNNDS